MAYFGEEKPLESISEGDCDEWYWSILKKRAENTARKHAAVAKVLFRAAVSKRLLASNPFSHSKATIKPNESRFHFITREVAEKVLDACPDAEWRLIFALSRLGACGARVSISPSVGSTSTGSGPRLRLRVPRPNTTRGAAPGNSVVRRVATILGRREEIGEAGGGVCHHPIPERQPEPPDATRADHSSRRRGFVAQAVPESEEHEGNGTIGKVPAKNRLQVAGQQ